MVEMEIEPTRIPLYGVRQPATRYRHLSTQDTAASSDDPNYIKVTNYNGGVFYYADVYIDGSPYNLLVDTGSSDLWVSCYYIDKSRCISTCPPTTIKIAYGSGTVCVYRDYMPVRLGGLILNDYAVGTAVGTNIMPGSNNLLYNSAKGILGLGYPALATIPSPAGYFLNFLKQFSVYLSSTTSGSFLLLNGVDDNLIAKQGLTPYTVPLKKASHWTVGITSVQIGSADAIMPCNEASMSKGSCDAIVDTGSTMLIMPSQVFDVLVQNYLLPGNCVITEKSFGQYVCKNSVKLPDILISLGTNMTFRLVMNDCVDHSYSSTHYVLEISPSSSSNAAISQSWVLGATFLKQFYSSYVVNKAVVLYCKEGTDCDQQGGSTLPVSSTTPGATPKKNSSVVPSPSGTSRSNSTSGSSATLVPSPGTGTANSSESNHTATVAVASVLACVAALLLITLLVRRWRSKRQRRHEDEPVSVLEMETVASTGGVGTRFVAASTPTNK